jgi:hypothetical protein
VAKSIPQNANAQVDVPLNFPRSAYFALPRARFKLVPVKI